MKNNNATSIFKKACIIISSLLILLFDVYFALNVEGWNGAHDGITELYLFLFIAIAIVLSVLLIKKKNLLANRCFVGFAVFFFVSVVFLVTVAFLFRCPYCHDWSLAKQ